MKKILFLALLILSNTVFARLNFVTTTHAGEWVLNNKASTLNFITTQNTNKTEVQTFKKIQGKISGTKVTLSVDLSSVDTGTEILDERLQELFFNVVKFPAATVTIDIKKSDIYPMKPGQIKNLKFDATITLQGISQTIPVKLQIVELDKNRRLVFSSYPVIINLKNFNLLKGVNALREIANLKSINIAVPVTFSLLFTKQ